MCLIDDCEPVDFFLVRRPKARKLHTCSECGRTISLGEKYTLSTYKHPDRDKPERNKTCSHCEVAAQWLQYHCGGSVCGAIKKDLEEHYDSGYREDGLQKLLTGIRRGWREFGSDDLLPIPRFVVRKVA